MKIEKPQGTNDKDLEKVSETTGGVNMFFFCDPSKVLSSFWASELTFREVNYQRDVGTSNIHLRT